MYLILYAQQYGTNILQRRLLVLKNRVLLTDNRMKAWSLEFNHKCSIWIGIGKENTQVICLAGVYSVNGARDGPDIF